MIREKLHLPRFRLKVFIGFSDEERAYARLVDVEISITRCVDYADDRQDDMKYAIINYADCVRGIIATFDGSKYKLIETLCYDIFLYIKKHFTQEMLSVAIYKHLSIVQVDSPVKFVIEDAA